MAQLRRPDNPPLFYALAVRLAEGWGSFVVIGRAQLQELWNKGCGSENAKSGDLEFHIQFRPDHREQRPGDGEAGNEPSMRGRLSSEAVQILCRRAPAHPLRRRLRSIWPISDLSADDSVCTPRHIL